MGASDGLLAGYRRPEYTGVNRCLPCTAVNALIAAGASLALGVAGWIAVAPVAGLGAGIAFLGLATIAIYLRGYLVPGTPTLTKRYFPEWMLGWFSKAEQSPPAPAGETVDVEAVLVTVGALEECADRPDLCLTPDFRVAWHDAMDDVTDVDAGPDRLLDLLDVDGETVDVEEYGGAFRAFVDGERVGTWQSEAAFRADLGAAAVFENRDPLWADRSVLERGQLLNGLRLFLDQCPSCGDRPEFGTTTVESCCSTHEVAAVECVGCGARVFEART